MSEYLADKSVLLYWLIDRIASGFKYDILRQLYKDAFELELSQRDYDDFCVKYKEDIETRNQQLRQQVEDSGLLKMMTTTATKLYNKLENEELNPKEYASISDALRKYSESLMDLGKSVKETTHTTTNNFLILQGLEQEGIIKIVDQAKLKYLVDGEVIDAVEH